MDDLPSYAEAAAAVEVGNATALQAFIYYNEPVGVDAEKEFRKAALDLVNEITEPYDRLVAACTYGAQVELPELLVWIADRFVHIHHENENTDFVQTIRHRATLLRTALNALKQGT